MKKICLFCVFIFLAFTGCNNNPIDQSGEEQDNTPIYDESVDLLCEDSWRYNSSDLGEYIRFYSNGKMLYRYRQTDVPVFLGPDPRYYEIYANYSMSKKKGYKIINILFECADVPMDYVIKELTENKFVIQRAPWEKVGESYMYHNNGRYFRDI